LLKKFFGISYNEKVTAIRILTRMSLIFFMLKILRFEYFKKWYSHSLPKNKKAIDQNLLIKYIKSIGSRLNFTCLPQALTLKYFLNSQTELIIGVQKQNEKFEAHAWVQQENEILIGESPNDHFTPIWTWK